MHLYTALAAAAALAAACSVSAAVPTDAWTAIDGLGRPVATSAQAGPRRDGKFVAMFYFLWLGEHGQTGPHDITKILAANPDALARPTSPPWGPLHAFHHWGQPLFGYYLSDDRWVLRRHAQMLSDAGIDTVIFDCTNNFTYPKSYNALGQTWEQMRREGRRTPDIAFLCPFGNAGPVVQELWDNLYSKGLYSDLWFKWDAKPLIMADAATVDEKLRDKFTFRKPIPSYFEGPTGPDQWGWLEVYPQHVFYNSKGEAEQMTVGVAQNAQKAKRLASMSEPDASGRSWHIGRKDLRKSAVNLGLNFQEQWDRALEVDPEVVFVTGWNEWVAMWLNSFGGVDLPVMFVDQFNQEYSRDIEPMAGGHLDQYYYQLVDNVRRFKGASAAPPASAEQTIRIDGRFDEWNDIVPVYTDDAGDNGARDEKGWGSAGPYRSPAGRNDISEARVARDAESIYFYVRTSSPISRPEGDSWMNLLIRTDPNEPNWESFNFAVNRRRTAFGAPIVERSTGGWNWDEVGSGRLAVRGNQMELAIPRKSLGLDPSSLPIRFDFKWTDSLAVPGDPMQFYLTGDTAPNGRFAYPYRGE